jgi:hypothetical protein
MLIHENNFLLETEKVKSKTQNYGTQKNKTKQNKTKTKDTEQRDWDNSP